MRHKKYWWLVTGLLLLTSLFLTTTVFAKSHTAFPTTSTTITPTILVPGSSATQDRFDRLIAKLPSSKGHPTSVVKLTVTPSGSLRVTGKLKPHDCHPFFVIAFQDNRDGRQNVNRQAKWLNLALTQLQANLHYHHFNALGHSNGGLIWTRYLEKYYHQRSAGHLDKLMTIATPFNMAERGQQRSSMLQELINGRGQLPRDLILTSVAGTQNYTDDGIVPLASVNQGRYIFQNQIASYTEVNVTGANTQHSELPQNQQIVNIMTAYLLPPVEK